MTLTSVISSAVGEFASAAEQDEATYLGYRFEDFVKQFWECVPAAGKLTWNWHMGVLCRELQMAAERVFRNQPREYDEVFNVPFGTSKSTIGSILFHPWTWIRFPQARHLTATHTEMLALDLANKSREVVRSGKYQEMFPHVKLRDNQDAKGYYANTLGGVRQSFTVGGKNPMGFHFHFLGVDDPIDPQKAVSETELRNAREFMNQTLPSRKVDKAVSYTYLIMQRLHRQDPTMVMLERAKNEDAAKVKLICLPGEVTGGITPAHLRDNYVDGLLDPVRLSRAILKEYRATLGPYGYSGQVLQNPTPPGGGMFKEKDFNKRVRSAPYEAKRVRYWDRAASEDHGCFTAGVLMALGKDGNFYIEDVVKGQWEPDERNARMVATALRDRSRYGPRHDPTIVIEAERGSTGLESFQNMARKLAGFKVKEDRPTGSKDVRAEPWADQVSAGTVYLVDSGESEGLGKATWDIASYVDDHVAFKPEPEVRRLGKWKDQIDASSGAFNFLISGLRQGGMRLLNPRTLGRQKGRRIIPCSAAELPAIIIEQKALLISLTDPEFAEEVMSSVGLHLSAGLSGSQGQQGNGVNAGQGGHGAAGEPQTGACAPFETPALPPHSLQCLLESLQLAFADIDPAEQQDSWDDPIPPWNKPAGELIMTRGDGKKLWAFLNRKRAEDWEVLVIQDDNDRRALSLALALADTLRLPRETALWLPSRPDQAVTEEEQPENAHVYNMVKSSRSLVV